MGQLATNRKLFIVLRLLNLSNYIDLLNYWINQYQVESTYDVHQIIPRHMLLMVV